MHTVSLVKTNYHFVSLYGGDTARFAQHYGSIVSTNKCVGRARTI
jgi:hypothetical protein